MKTSITIALLTSLISFSLAQDVPQEVSSKIEQVTVFLQGAQVTRNVDVNLKQGVSVLSLSGISPRIQEQSIQVDGPAGVKILSVSFRVNYLDNLKKPEKVAALDVERRTLLSLVAQEKSQQEVYKEEEAILITNKSIGGTTTGVKIEELKIAMDYFRQRLTDIKQLQLQADRKIAKYTEEIRKVEAQLTALSTIREQPTGEILIKVSSQQPTNADFDVKYLVKEAHWIPSYDIRAKNVNSPISITYKASVNQQSGEDWKNVELTISSGNPDEGGSQPIIKPWFLGFNNALARRTFGVAYGAGNNFARGRVTDENGAPVPGVNVLIKGTTVGTVSDIEGYYSIPLTADAQTLLFSFIGFRSEEIPLQGRSDIDLELKMDATALSEVVVTGYGFDNGLAGRVPGLDITTSKVKKSIVATPVIRQTNVEFTLDEPFTVDSDAEMRTTDMVEYELDALYEYYSVPKLEPDAFLTAKVLHWDEFNFLEGEANLFFEGKYIGKSVLDTRNTSDTLTLSLGRDGNVVVKREKKKDFSSKQFVGSNQKILFDYEITVRNKKAQPITIVIADQIPVSNDKEIVVDKLGDSKAEFVKDSGLLTWKKIIAPGKTELIGLSYAIRYPKGNSIILE